MQKAWGQPPLPGHGESGDGVIGALSQFVVIINEPNPVAGQSFSITIRATDMQGNLDETFGGSVLISTDNEFGAGVVTTVGPFFEGERPHNINVKQATWTTITATNAAEGQNQTGTSDPFMVGPAGVSSFLVQECHSGKRGPGAPTDIGIQRAGVPFDLCITALDQFGNHATGFTGTVLLEANNNAFGAGVDEITGAFTSGSISWPVSVTQLSENTSIRAENTAGAQQGTSNEFNVIEGLPAIIEIIPQPPAFVLAGEPIFPAPSVIIKDNFGNVLKDIPVDVELLKNGTGFSFAAGSVTRVVTDDDGRAEFANLKISQVGEDYQLKFLVGEELEKLSGLFVTVLPGAPTVMNIEKEPVQSIAGQPLAGPPTIKLIDAGGNGVPGYPITVAVSSGIMTGTEIIVTDGDGLAVFNDLEITQAGIYSLTFSTTPAGVVDVTSDDFTVIGTSIDRLEVTAAEGNEIPDKEAGEAFDLRIVAYDVYNNIAGVFNGTVDLTTDSEFGSEVATTTGNFVAGVLESHTVSLTLAATGVSITAVNSEEGQEQTGTSNQFVVSHTELSQFLISFASSDKPAGNQPVPHLQPEPQLQSNPQLQSSPASQGMLRGRHQPPPPQLQAQHSFTNPFQPANHQQPGNYVLIHQQNNRIGQQTAGEYFNITISAADPFANVVLSYTGSVELSTNYEFGVGVATTTADLSSGVLISHPVNLRIAATDAIITASGGGQTGSSDPFEVLPKPITLTVNHASRIYGAGDPPFSFVDFFDQLIPNDAVADVTGGSGTANDVTFQTTTTVLSDAGVYNDDIDIQITSFNGSRADSYNITIEKGTLTIGTKTATITAVDAEKTYGELYAFDPDDPSAYFSTDGLVNDDVVASVTLESDGAPVTADIGSYAIILSDAAGDANTNVNNYDISFVPGTLNVGQRTLTISAVDKDKVYGEVFVFDPNWPSDDFEFTGLVNAPPDAINTVSITSSGAPANAPVGTYSITIDDAQGVNLGNYSIIYKTAGMQVNRRPLSITADDQYKDYDELPFPYEDFTVSYDGFAPGEGPDDLVGTLSFTGTAIDATQPGFWVITPGGLSSHNYEITFVDGELLIGDMPEVPISNRVFLLIFILMLSFIAFRIKA